MSQQCNAGVYGTAQVVTQEISQQHKAAVHGIAQGLQKRGQCSILESQSLGTGQTAALRVQQQHQGTHQQPRWEITEQMPVRIDSELTSLPPYTQNGRRHLHELP